MPRAARPVLALLALGVLAGCGQAPATAVATGAQAAGYEAKGAGAPMPKEQAAALVKVLDKNGDGQLRHDEAHVTLLWGTHDYLSNSPDIFDPAKPGKPIPVATAIEKLGTAGSKFLFSGAVGVKDQHLVKMPAADIRRIADGVAKVLAQGPDIQRGKVPVRHVVVRHYIFRPGKDEMRWESPRWIAGTIEDQMKNENNAITIESGGRHKDGAYQFYFYEHKVF